jgi:predicted PurR-regulated permease PerM
MPELIARKLERSTNQNPESTIKTILIGVVVVVALYLGREVLVPIALAVLLTFVLAPLVRFLQVWYFPRIVAVTVVGLVAFAAILGLGALMVSQVNQLAGDLPRYQSTLGDKIESLRGVVGGTGTLERASEVLHDLSKEINRPNNNAPASSLSENAASNKPIPVEIKQPDPGALQTLAVLITPLIHPLTTTGIVAIFVIFILLQRQDLRNRLVRLAGAQDLQRTTAALDDAGQRLSRLFLTQLAVNASFGCVIGLGLWIIGVPSAPLWGMLAMIMRFVPYIGAVISAIFPLILAAAVGSGWTMFLITATLFIVAETIVGQAIEPLVYGQSTGLSPVAIIVSATFWTWLWGPVGLILATPLSMCLVVVGRHVDRLEFLEVMFGDQPPLTPAELIYQRMLANDPVEAAEQARMFLKEKPLVEYYDEILLDGLRLAEADSKRGLLNDERKHRIRDAVAEIVDDLSAHEDRIEPVERGTAEGEAVSPLAHLDKAEGVREAKGLPDRWRQGHPVLCIPGIGLLDQAIAILVAQLLERRGIGARSEQADALSLSRILSLDTKNVVLICLCYLGNATSAQVGYAIRRVRRKAPRALIVVCLFGNAASIEGLDQYGDLEVVTLSLHATVEKIVTAAIRLETENRVPELGSPPSVTTSAESSRKATIAI